MGSLLYKTLKENKELKKRLVNVTNELQKQLISEKVKSWEVLEEGEIKEGMITIEELIEIFKDKNKSMFGMERYCEGIVIMKVMSEELISSLIGEREYDDEEINVNVKGQAAILILEKCYEKMEKLLGKGSIYDEKILVQGVNIWKKIEEIYNVNKSFLNKLKEVIGLTKKNIERGKRNGKEIIFVQCIECDKILKVEEWTKERSEEIRKEFRKMLKEHIQKEHNCLKERIDNMIKKVTDKAVKGIKEELWISEGIMVVREIYVEMMKQYGIFEKEDSVEKGKEKCEKGIGKYKWFKKEEQREVENIVKELVNIVPKGSIEEMFKELDNVIKYVKDNENDSEITDLLKDG